MMWEDIQNAWAAVVFIFSSVGVFFVWLRSLLNKRPSIAQFRARGHSLLRAIWAKLAFIKTKLVVGFLFIANAIVFVYDQILPLIIGVDWTPLISEVPPLMWSIFNALVLILIYWLRTVTARETNEMVAAVEIGITPKEAVMMVAAGEAPKLTVEQKVT